MKQPFHRLPSQEQERAIYALLDHLVDSPQPDGYWQGWYVTRITGGFNNLLYRATNAENDLAIKFTIRDGRHRARREYSTLQALQRAGLSIAPQPVLLDCDRYPQPVVVQTWLTGDTLAIPPVNEQDWGCLLRHLAIVHSLTPANTNISLSPAVGNVDSVETGKHRIQEELAQLPPEVHPASSKTFLNRLETIDFPHQPDPPITLCRSDNNHFNFIRRPGQWASVDWEASGWGDPTSDLAELMIHPGYIGVPHSRWEWVVDTYGCLTGRPASADRIWAFYKILLVWWVVRSARYLYEIAQGTDRRLATLPINWEERLWFNHQHYLDLADTLL